MESPQENSAGNCGSARDRGRTKWNEQTRTLLQARMNHLHDRTLLLGAQVPCLWVVCWVLDQTVGKTL